MAYADKVFLENLDDLTVDGTWDENPRPKYKDGESAHSRFITDVYVKYKADITPIISLRHTAWKTGIKEIIAIYQKQVNTIAELEGLGVKWWNSWAIPFDNGLKEVVRVKTISLPDSICTPVECGLQNEIMPSIDGKVRVNEYQGYGEYSLIDEYKEGKYIYYKYQFAKTGYIGSVRKDSIIGGGHPTDNFTRTLVGVGYLGNFNSVDGYTKSQIVNLKKKWSQMIERAYGDNRPNYKDVFVDAQWHSFETFLRTVRDIPQFQFAMQDDFNTDWQLDKDYYGKNHYSPRTTMFSKREDNIDYVEKNIVLRVTSVIDNEHKVYLTRKKFADAVGVSINVMDRWIKKGKSPDGTLVIEKLDEEGYVYRYSLQQLNIGLRYGATVKKWDLMNKLLDGLVNDPFSRRHIINLYQYSDLAETEGLHPCAFLTEWACRRAKDGKMYLDMALKQRSSDFGTAYSINQVQYKAFQMMVACHCGYEVGTFSHHVMNLHGYDRHGESLAQLVLAEAKLPEGEPKLVLNVPSGTNFYDIDINDFKMINYNPVVHEPKLEFELAI